MTDFTVKGGVWHRKGRQTDVFTVRKCLGPKVSLTETSVWVINLKYKVRDVLYTNSKQVRKKQNRVTLCTDDFLILNVTCRFIYDGRRVETQEEFHLRISNQIVKWNSPR